MGRLSGRARAGPGRSESRDGRGRVGPKLLKI